ncbi:SGNH/GDSL hydrolase family protein [Lentzea flaviverrucosa]|uniref:Lysophospholipase L1 n=1 Tax=Lentzea flaviverrucosa TaxID=200379 RepID=A0A1H9RBX4_9PSEU|nr:SGNH/GDSL hydrolase family protein [Lentzea flaviverrucosa]RDI32956.1 lysophospholipase L1-like esterase [Lentzea flaviverrucosa]SER70431.1 Lysophospholipase L1 [Lentzea flaviverrucosa]
MNYQRFVALGDSCAEGLDDLLPDGRYRGWADRVASALDAPGFRYANLAVRGRRLDQMLVEQVPSATALEPDLVVLFGGGNDVMSGATQEQIAERADAMVRAVTSFAPTVAVFTLSDISHRMPFGRRMRPRIETLNSAMRTAAARYGAILVDVETDECVHDSRYFGPDRLHLSSLGHRRLAGHVLSALGIPFDESWLAPLEGRAAPASVLDHWRWLRDQVLPVAYSRTRNKLIGRQPGDGFVPKRPELAPLTWPQRVAR